MHLEYVEMLGFVIHAESMELIGVKVLLRTLMRFLPQKRRYRRALIY